MFKLNAFFKKTGFIVLCGIILSSFIPNHIAFSDTLNDLQTEKQEVDREVHDLSSEMKQKNGQLDQSEQEMNLIRDEIQALNKQLSAVLADVESVSSSINETAQDLEELHKSVLLLEKRLYERDDILRNRIRTLQAKDRLIDLIDLLLDSDSLADLLSRYTMSATLLKADRQIIESQQHDYTELEKLKTLLAEKLKEQRMNNKRLQQTHSTLESQKNQTHSTLDNLEEEKHTLLHEKADIESRYAEARKRSDELAEEILAIQNRQVSYSQEYTSSAPSVSSPAACTATGTVNEEVYYSRFQNAGALSGKGQSFIDIAQEYNIDPVLMAAVSFHETGMGTSNAVVNYNNPGGLMNPATNWSTLIRFTTLEDGLRSTAKTLNKLMYKGGLSSIGDLGSVYAPLGAANDPTGLNQHWEPRVTQFVNELGGLTTNCGT